MSIERPQPEYNGVSEPRSAMTRVTFRILPPLYAMNHVVLKQQTSLGMCEISFQVVHSGNAALFGTGAIATGDDYGALHNTLVTCTFDAFIAFNDPQPAGIRVHWAPLDAAVDVLNLVIEHYRIVERFHSLRRVARRQIQAFIYTTRPGMASGEKPSFGYCWEPAGLNPEGEDAGVRAGDDVIAERFQSLIEAGPPALARVTFSDAEAEVLAGNVRSGLVLLYIAFEMVVTSQHERLGRAVVGGQKYVESFSADDSSEYVPPSIFTVVKQCRGWAGYGPSQTALEKQVRAILKHRNALMHGRNPEVTVADVHTAFQEFSNLVTWLTSVTPISVV